MDTNKKIPPWLITKTQPGKSAVIAALHFKIYNEFIDYDKFGALYPDIEKFIDCDNFPDMQQKFISDYYPELLEGTSPDTIEEKKKDIKKKSSGTVKKENKTSTTKKNDNPEKSSDIEGKEKKKRGRPLKNDISSYETIKAYKRAKNADSFLLVNTEKTIPEILSNTELYTELLKDTVKQVYDSFLENYPEKTKKHPSIWFRHLCLLVKENTPKIQNTNNYDIINAAWDVYAALCLTIGINRTIENFQIFTGLSWYTIDKLKQGTSPECIEVSKKIYSACRSDIVGGLASSFGSNPNQMFIAKSVYGLTENTVITHVSANEIKKNLDDIPVFNMDSLPEK